MKTISKLNTLLTVFLVSGYFGFAQSVPTLELTNRLVAPGSGPTTTPLVIPFEVDAINNHNFDNYTPALNLTVSFRNQVYTGLTYSNISTGMVFGGAPSLSSDGPIQQVTPYNRYDILAAYNGAGGPESSMFTSNPNAVGTNLGTGFDIDGNLFGNGVNSGVEILTASQVLYDLNKPKDAREEFGEIVLTFSRPVINPVIHVAGLGGSYRYLPFGAIDNPVNYKTSYFSSELELQTPGFTSTKLSGNANLNLVGNNILNSAFRPNGGSVFVPGDLFDNYGAATGSIRITGVVTQLVYKVFLRGSTASDMNFSTLGSNVTCGATACGHNPFTGDQWYISASLDKPTQQLSGNIFVDKDGLTDNNVNQSAGIPNPTTNIGGSLFANLLNTAGQVVASIPVGNNGAYLFDKVPPGTYSVQLTTNASSGTYFSPAAAPAYVLPPTWGYTGEFVGNVAGNDGTVDGKSSSVVVNALDIKTEVNFGIERLPESNSYPNFIDRPTLNQVITLVDSLPVLSGSDPEDQPINGSLAGKAIRIDTLPSNAILLYGGVQVFVGQVIPNYTPSLLQIKFTMPNAGFSGFVKFNYSYIDAAGLADPTPAFYSLQWPAGNALPIVLSDFAAIKNNCNATLNWKTASELNSERFEIQYSTNTNTNFETLGAIAASGNSTSTKGYQYNFSMESGVFYYFRLKMYKKDGTFTYSEIRTLSCLDTRSEIVVLPNPAVNSFHIEKMAKGKNTVSIYSNEGKLIKTLNVVNKQIIDISDLASGGYVLRILNENGTASVEKLVKY